MIYDELYNLSISQYMGEDEDGEDIAGGTDEWADDDDDDDDDDESPEDDEAPAKDTDGGEDW